METKAQEGKAYYESTEKLRIMVTTDAEIDDECSLNRFLLYANEWDIEGIVTTSSQYHWQGHNWAGDDWTQQYLDGYAKVYPNLVKHDPNYPTPEYLESITVIGNVKGYNDMEEATVGSDLIVKSLLNDKDPRPLWIQAWGGTNSIARAFKTIEEDYPDRMEEAASKARLYMIWEQDDTFQDYILPVWGKYNIPTIISDQFIAVFYDWKKYLPQDVKAKMDAKWMNANILKNHGPLCELYKAYKKDSKTHRGEFLQGDFRSEGDSPSYFYNIPTGLRSMESPSNGGWGGRFVKVRDNIWLDPVEEPGYEYPEGKWYTDSAWGRCRLREEIPNDEKLIAYLKPQWRWLKEMQNDWAARADWCVKPYEEANHQPIVKLAHPLDMDAKAGDKVALSAQGTTDPDGDELTFKWWHYLEADSYDGIATIEDADNIDATLIIPDDAKAGQTIHIVCEVTDSGTPPLTRYQRVIITVK